MDMDQLRDQLKEQELVEATETGTVEDEKCAT
jgi:hypothetical protein